MLADSGDGPQISYTASVVIARNIARCQLQQHSAMPRMGLFTLDEFMDELSGFDVQQSVAINTLDSISMTCRSRIRNFLLEEAHYAILTLAVSIP